MGVNMGRGVGRKRGKGEEGREGREDAVTKNSLLTLGAARVIVLGS